MLFILSSYYVLIYSLAYNCCNLNRFSFHFQQILLFLFFSSVLHSYYPFFSFLPSFLFILFFLPPVFILFCLINSVFFTFFPSFTSFYFSFDVIFFSNPFLCLFLKLSSISGFRSFVFPKIIALFAQLHLIYFFINDFFFEDLVLSGFFFSLSFPLPLFITLQPSIFSFVHRYPS